MQVSKKLVKEIIEDWITEFKGYSILVKVKNDCGIVPKGLAEEALLWRTTELMDFYRLGLIEAHEVLFYLDKFEKYVEANTPESTIIDLTRERIWQTVEPTEDPVEDESISHTEGVSLLPYPHPEPISNN